MNRTKDLYFVAVKVLLRRDAQLLITHDVFGDWDIPGGRIKPDEFETPMQDIAARKIREELGGQVVYELQEPKVFFRHQRIEKSTNEKARIFAIGYEATYKSGQIELGSNHDEFIWVNLNEFDPKKYFKGGWLKGISEYMELESK